MKRLIGWLALLFCLVVPAGTFGRDYEAEAKAAWEKLRKPLPKPKPGPRPRPRP